MFTNYVNIMEKKKVRFLSFSKTQKETLLSFRTKLTFHKFSIIPNLKDMESILCRCDVVQGQVSRAWRTSDKLVSLTKCSICVSL